MKTCIFFVLIFCVCSCISIKGNKEVNEGSIIYYKSKSFDTKLAFEDVENSNEMAVVPHIIIENGKIDRQTILNYLKNSSVEKWGDHRFLRIGFNVPKEYNIIQMEYIITVSQESVIELFPEFEGVFEIVIKYSSKGNDWLKLPPPPELN